MWKKPALGFAKKKKKKKERRCCEAKRSDEKKKRRAKKTGKASGQRRGGRDQNIGVSIKKGKKRVGTIDDIFQCTRGKG